MHFKHIKTNKCAIVERSEEWKRKRKSGDARGRVERNERKSGEKREEEWRRKCK
jgi:hypothetical protein